MNNKKPAMFCDFDGFKFNTLPAHRDYINQKYNINIITLEYSHGDKLEDLINQYLSHEDKVTRAYVYEDLAKNFLTSIDWHKEVKPFEDMPEVMKELSQKYRIMTVTARQKTSINSIQYLIDKFIPDCIEEIHCVWEHLGNGEFKENSKRDFILNHKGEKIGFFDDSPKEILRLHDAIPSYLFDPTGLHDSNLEIENRIRSWKEIGDLLL